MTRMPNASAAPVLVEWGVAAAALAGEAESGDLEVVMPFAEGVLVAAIDALGHGQEAAYAARAAAAILHCYPEESIVALLERCHERLRGTRGAAMSLASFDARAGLMTWTGVGNVEGVLVRAEGCTARPREAILLRGGVVGYQLPSLRPTAHAITAGDTVIFATDGIRVDFAENVDPTEDPQCLAEKILARSGRGTDDALVVVARYVGGAA